MVDAVFDACDTVETITLEMRNQHRLLVDLEPFGLDNPNEIFVPTSEPFGMISATVDRGSAR
jgi:urate oxidase